MAGLPGWLLAQAGQDVVVEAYEGAGGAGPRYADPVTVRMVVEAKRQRVRNSLGKEVVSSTVARGQLSITAPPESRVTLADGRVTYVITETRHDGRGLPVPSHVELALT